MKSLFRATYTVCDASEQPLFQVVQSKPWAALLDSLLSAIPFAEFVTGYILNPTYVVASQDTPDPVVLMKKQPSFFESIFVINSVQKDLTEKNELLILLSLLMIVQLERNRG